MSVKRFSVAVTVVTLVLCFYLGDRDQADAKLEEFYSQMASANFAGARRSIDGAIQLWPGNERYYAWRGYLTSQNLPSTCTRRAQQNRAALPQDKDASAQQA